MKQRILLLSFFILPILVSAQCKDCLPKDDWKFAAGVTLYSNNLYVYNENLLERQPLEFNFRYKFGQNHIIRLSTPMAWKVKLTRDPSYTDPNYALDENLDNKALAYLDGMKHDATYSEYFKTKESYYNLFGGSIGYDYNLNLGYGVSLAAGIDFSYYCYKSIQKFYGVDYTVLDGSNMAALYNLNYVERTNEWNALVAKPVIGLRYQFQKLLLEGTVGYAFTHTNGHADLKIQDISMADDYSTFDRKYNFNKMVFQLSLFYTL